MSSEPIERPVGGAPRIYNRITVLERIRDELARGDRTMDQICQDPGMPDRASVYLWVSEGTEESQRLYDILKRGQELWCLAQQDQIIKIADDQSRDIMETDYMTRGGEVRRVRTSDNTAVNRDRLRVMARQWAMAKLAPKVFGDRAAVEVTGANGAPLMPAISINIASAPVVGISPLPVVDISPEPKAIEASQPLELTLDHENKTSHPVELTDKTKE